MTNKMIALLLALGTTCLTTSAHADLCSIVYQYSYYGGADMGVQSGYNGALAVQGWDDMVSSIDLSPGCFMMVYTDPNYSGNGMLVYQDQPTMPAGWDNAISSYYCSCSQAEYNCIVYGLC